MDPNTTIVYCLCILFGVPALFGLMIWTLLSLGPGDCPLTLGIADILHAIADWIRSHTQRRL